ncbi:hypothetical protein [Caulobacter phage KcrB]|nr:hypothetical protein RW_GP087c [Caulobacter phage RW]WCA46391.1 hypothetical protein [Caulobacter phage KcrB]WCD56326.1 hypothetical protein [Caulobacter phage RLK]WNV48118.1 hypothetical protein GB2A_gp086c [Caulobacter phage GB2A]
MSTISQPFGLRPAYHPSGTIRPTALTINSGYSSNILENQPVRIVPSSTGEGTVVAAAIGEEFIGTFMGVQWVDTDGRFRVSNKWTASTVGTDIVCYVTLDPTIVYNIQANATMTVADIGKQFDFTTITAGSTVTGLSALMLDVASAATNASMRVIGLTPGPDNAWGDAFPVVQVQISEHQNVANKAAY